MLYPKSYHVPADSSWGIGHHHTILHGNSEHLFHICSIPSNSTPNTQSTWLTCFRLFTDLVLSEHSLRSSEYLLLCDFLLVTLGIAMFWKLRPQPPFQFMSIFLPENDHWPWLPSLNLNTVLPCVIIDYIPSSSPSSWWWLSSSPPVCQTPSQAFYKCSFI